MGSTRTGRSSGLFGGGLLLVVAGQWIFTRSWGAMWGVPVWVTGFAALGWWCRDRDEELWTRSPHRADDQPSGATSTWSGPAVAGTALAALAAAVTLWTVQRSRPIEQPRRDLVVLWLASIGLAGLAIWQPRADRFRDAGSAMRVWWARHQIDVLASLGLGLAAMGPMLYRLDLYPRSLNGDEAAFALIARRVLNGEIRNPFGVGYMSHPLMWNVVQAGSMRVFGDDVVGARAPNAVAGAVAVSLAYLLVLRLTGHRFAAVAAALLLATFHVHLYFSRSALPNGWTAVSALLALYLLDVAMRGNRPIGLFVAGAATGFSQYFYFSSRILLPIVLVVLGVTGLAETEGVRRLRSAARRWLGQAVFVVLGFVLTTLPQMAYYSVRRHDFDSRARSVSIFGQGWLSEESERTGHPPIVVLLRQLLDAGLFPFRSMAVGQYRAGVPFIGWSLALLAAVGLAVATARIGRGGLWTALALTYWVSAAGIATTIGPTELVRWVGVAVVLCLLAGIGLDTVARVVAEQWPVVRTASFGFAAIVLIATASVNLHRHFRSPSPVDVSSDLNTEVVEHLARSLATLDGSPTVYFGAAPRIWFGGFSNFAFRAPLATGIDIEQPLDRRSIPPEVSGVTLFVFVPERSSELEIVKEWFPNGRQSNVVDDRGVELYTSYLVDP